MRIMSSADIIAAEQGLCPRWPDSLGLWSRFCRLSPRAGQARSWSSLIPPLRKSSPSSLPLVIMQGHVHLMARQHELALDEYLKALTLLNPQISSLDSYSSSSKGGICASMEVDQDEGEGEGLPLNGREVENKEPLLMLLVGVMLLNIASTKALKVQTMGRNRTVLAAFAFLDGYASERTRRARDAVSSEDGEGEEEGVGKLEGNEGCQLEVGYNLGRGAHQMGQVQLARSHYLDVLRGGSEGPCKFEAAHNLAMIYCANGDRDAAREVYQRNLVI